MEREREDCRDEIKEKCECDSRFKVEREGEERKYTWTQITKPRNSVWLR